MKSFYIVAMCLAVLAAANPLGDKRNTPVDCGNGLNCPSWFICCDDCKESYCAKSPSSCNRCRN